MQFFDGEILTDLMLNWQCIKNFPTVLVTALIENIKVSLSTVVLNSRDRYEKLWLPEFFALLKTTL